MTTLEQINITHQKELEALNERIHRELTTSNPLMANIVISLLRTKGKQLRPLLVLMCASMFGPIDDKALAAASAVELLHNASLIHDDVVDNSMTRRGRPTVNAISTGDIRIVEALTKLGRSLSLGEIDQIYNARQHSLTKEGYYRIIDYKTASLFVASAEMGCYAAGAPREAREALSLYALFFGRCFQIRDDVFDYFPSELVGKPTGNDLREGKISLPLLHALDGPESPERNHIIELLAKDSLTDEEIAEIQDFARNNGGIEYAFAEMRRLRDEALSALACLGPSAILDELADLFDFIIERQF